MYLVHSDCVTAAGLGVNHLMSGLYEGIDHSKVIQGNEFFKPVASGGRVCFISEDITEQKTKNRNIQAALQTVTQKCWKNFYHELSQVFKNKLQNSKSLILFSSTKGIIEDYIWDLNDISLARNHQDPFSSFIHWFKDHIKELFLDVDFEVVSNACASSHVAIEVAQMSIQSGAYQNVLVISADMIGPFVYQGFSSLKVLTHTSNKPFDESRDGLQLGEAVALMLFSDLQNDKCNLKISSVFSETEGGSVTRPSMDGHCLFRLMKKVLVNSMKTPDFFLAHGTGTKFNDQSELLAVDRIKNEFQFSAPMTGIKWSVGHTLGASGLLDVIAAGEILKCKKFFNFKNSVSPLNSIPKNALVTSLGFGGIHSALQLESLGD